MDGDADICRRQSGRIVDAVADKTYEIRKGMMHQVQSHEAVYGSSKECAFEQKEKVHTHFPLPR